MKFGLLKSKIEKNLLESYHKNSFKDEMKVFKTLVLENKNLKKLFFIYDELTSSKGYTKDDADQYINECITIYENVINKINPRELKVLELWVGDTNTENLYENIDNLFSSNIKSLETKIQSRKTISEGLSKPTKEQKEVINIPLSTMVKIANQTIEKHLVDLNESDKKQLVDLLKEDNEKLKTEFDSLKNELLSKLKLMKENTDSETTKKIDESIQKINTEKYDKLTYLKLRNLNENI